MSGGVVQLQKCGMNGVFQALKYSPYITPVDDHHGLDCRLLDTCEMYTICIEHKYYSVYI